MRSEIRIVGNMDTKERLDSLLLYKYVNYQVRNMFVP